jgi:purine-binding chemotaxis protein CheW
MSGWDKDGGPVEILILGLDTEIVAIEASIVREIVDVVPITDVPNAYSFVRGLINVRGRVAPLADLRIRLDMGVSPVTIDTRIVVVDIDLQGEPTTVGLLADRVYEVGQITPAAITETPRVGMHWRPEFIRGIGKRGGDFMIVLDIDRILDVADFDGSFGKAAE